mmetsp:Transcript_12893/g.40697  ORF Transcript_12893/g.40697 Transcript_12893/m.40697 type:complete len:469 (-) Transcript_12893:1248-2654(-)
MSTPIPIKGSVHERGSRSAIVDDSDNSESGSESISGLSSLDLSGSTLSRSASSRSSRSRTTTPTVPTVRTESHSSTASGSTQQREKDIFDDEEFFSGVISRRIRRHPTPGPAVSAEIVVPSQNGVSASSSSSSTAGKGRSGKKTMKKRRSSRRRKSSGKLATSPSSGGNSRKGSLVSRKTSAANLNPPVQTGTSSSSSIAVAAQAQQQQQAAEIWKSSSTNSLFLVDTMSNPDTPSLVTAMARAALKFFEESLKNPVKPRYPAKVYAIFNSSDRTDGDLPSLWSAANYIGSIVRAGDIAPQSCVMFALLLDRLRTRMNLTPQCWRRVVLSTLILSCKVWEDEAVWNSDFEELFPELDNKTLTQLEKQLLIILSYQVTMTAAQYAEYFFAMKSLAPAALPARPLTDREVRRLEMRSAQTEASARAGKGNGNSRNIQRSVDFDRRGHVMTQQHRRGTGPVRVRTLDPTVE